jgi:hypothetical protein
MGIPEDVEAGKKKTSSLSHQPLEAGRVCKRDDFIGGLHIKSV